jgi:hypothetical protein
LRTHRDEKIDAPVVLVKWYDWTKWLLERVDSFPKNQRFVFGQRLADRGTPKGVGSLFYCER